MPFGVSLIQTVLRFRSPISLTCDIWGPVREIAAEIGGCLVMRGFKSLPEYFTYAHVLSGKF